MALLSSQFAVFSFTIFASLFKQFRHEVGTALILADERTPALSGQGPTNQFAILNFPGNLRPGLELELVAKLFGNRHLPFC